MTIKTSLALQLYNSRVVAMAETIVRKVKMSDIKRRLQALEKVQGTHAAAEVRRVGIYDPAEGVPDDDDGPVTVWLPENGRSNESIESNEREADNERT